MNDILQRQRDDHFVHMLAAQRQLYDDYKRWMGIWADDPSVSDADILADSRRLQGEIYRNRSDNPSVPSWFFRLRRNKYETLTNTPDTFASKS